MSSQKNAGDHFVSCDVDVCIRDGPNGNNIYAGCHRPCDNTDWFDFDYNADDAAFHIDVTTEAVRITCVNPAAPETGKFAS